MHPFDIISLFVFGVAIVIGMFQGLWKLLTGWFSLAFSILLAYNLSPRLKSYFPEFIPFPQILSFLIIFVISLLIFAFLLKSGKKAIKNLGLSFWDKLFGSLTSFFLSILFILAIIHLIDTLGFYAVIKNAKIPQILLAIETKIVEKIK